MRSDLVLCALITHPKKKFLKFVFIFKKYRSFGEKLPILVFVRHVNRFKQDFIETRKISKNSNFCIFRSIEGSCRSLMTYAKFLIIFNTYIPNFTSYSALCFLKYLSRKSKIALCPYKTWRTTQNIKKSRLGWATTFSKFERMSVLCPQTTSTPLKSLSTHPYLCNFQF